MHENVERFSLNILFFSGLQSKIQRNSVEFECISQKKAANPHNLETGTRVYSVFLLETFHHSSETHQINFLLMDLPINHFSCEISWMLRAKTTQRNDSCYIVIGVELFNRQSVVHSHFPEFSHQQLTALFIDIHFNSLYFRAILA